MKPPSPRSIGAALLLGIAASASAQVIQIGTGQPNSANGIFVTAMTIEAGVNTPCADFQNFQAATPGAPWNQNYGGVATYFNLPAGNGNQTFSMDFTLFRPGGGMLFTPSIQVFVDGALCTTCNAQVTDFETFSGGNSASGTVVVTHQAGHAWSTNGIREFGLRFTFPPQAGPWLDIRFKAVMMGTSFTEVLGTYDAPALPLYILRDPPGGLSFSSLTTGSSTCFGTTRSVTAGDEQGGYFKAKLGVAGEAGFIVTTAFEFSVEAGVSINATQTQTSDFEYQTCLEVSTEYNTSSSGTPEDLFIGHAVRYKYGMATVIERPTCGTVTKDAFFVSAPDSTLMEYSYSETFLRNQIIPDLEELIAEFTPGTPAHKKAVVQRGVWLRLLEINREIKTAGEPFVVRSFNGLGNSLQYSQTTTTTSSVDIDYEVSLENGLSLDLAFEIGGSGLSAGMSVKMRNSYGLGQTQSNEATNTMSYTLGDDDPDDSFSVEVRKDPYFGTFAFLLDSANSRTGCRYEGGYQLDQPSLSVGSPGNTSMTVNQAPIGSQVIFPHHSLQQQRYHAYLPPEDREQFEWPGRDNSGIWEHCADQ